MSTDELITFKALVFAAALVQSFHVIIAVEAGTPDTPELTECTQKEITRCYTEYVEIFYSYAPQHGSENTLSEDAYTKVC
ncbi:hypothetical protein V5799_024399, partial [Amblyomma americanum]